MLDDLNYIKQIDKSDALAVAGKQAEQLLFDFKTTVTVEEQIQNIVVGGMGGSAWPALILNTWPGLKVPLEISRNYSAPQYVSQSSLYIASSYSGNTEEAVASLEDAATKKANIVVIASGGKLVEVAKENGYPLFLVPSGLQPRMSSFYFLAAFIEILGQVGLVNQEIRHQLHDAGKWLSTQNTNWLPSVPTDQNRAKQIAEKVLGKSAIIYSGPLLFPAATKWKICFNENAKNLAWHNQYSELNHNEAIGWTSHPIEKPFATIEIRSNFEHERIKKRFDLTNKLLSGKKPHPVVIDAEGDTVLKQLLWAFSLGEYTSLYLAILNNVDPTPVDLVEKFKVELG